MAFSPWTVGLIWMIPCGFPMSSEREVASVNAPQQEVRNDLPWESRCPQTDGRSYSIFTARAARIAIVPSDMVACSIISILAQRESTGTSVGENAVLVLKARNR